MLCCSPLRPRGPQQQQQHIYTPNKKKQKRKITFENNPSARTDGRTDGRHRLTLGVYLPETNESCTLVCIVITENIDRPIKLLLGNIYRELSTLRVGPAALCTAKTMGQELFVGFFARLLSPSCTHQRTVSKQNAAKSLLDV